MDMSVLERQKLMLDEYCMGNKPMRSVLDKLQQECDISKQTFEELDIQRIQSVCNSYKTRRSFESAKTIVKGFYSYLQCDKTVEYINSFVYDDSIQYFPAFFILKNHIDECIDNAYLSGNIIDKNRYANLRMCLYLTFFGLSADEIAELKMKDYSKDTLTLKERQILLPKEMGKEIEIFSRLEGYKVEHRNSTYNVSFVPSENFIKLVKAGTVLTRNNISVLIKRSEDILDFTSVDVRKSGELWRLFNSNGFDLETLLKNVKLAKSINWIDAASQVNDKTNNIFETEIKAFAKSISEYVSHL